VRHSPLGWTPLHKTHDKVILWTSRRAGLARLNESSYSSPGQYYSTDNTREYQHI